MSVTPRRAMSTTERGRAFEEVVAWVCQVTEPRAVVKVQEWMDDPAAKGLRLMDITIRTNAGGISLLTLLEARCHERRVPVEYVEAIVTRHRDMGADRSAIASAKGFQKKAKNKAATHGVRLFKFTEMKTTAVEWIRKSPLTGALRVYRVRQVGLTMGAPLDPLSPAPLIIDATEPQLKVVAQQILAARGHLPIEYVDRGSDTGPLRLLHPLSSPSPLGLRRADGTVVAVRQVRIVADRHEQSLDVPLAPFEFSEDEGELLVPVGRGAVEVFGTPVTFDVACGPAEEDPTRQCMNVRIRSELSVDFPTEVRPVLASTERRQSRGGR